MTKRLVLILALCVGLGLASLGIVGTDTSDGPDDVGPRPTLHSEHGRTPVLSDGGGAVDRTSVTTEDGWRPRSPEAPDPAAHDTTVPPTTVPDEVPAGFHVTGRIATRGGDPVPAAEVVVTFTTVDGLAATTRTRTGADGRYLCTVEAYDQLEATRRGMARVGVEATAPGYRPERTERPVSRAVTTDDRRSLAVDLVIEPGSVIEGGVVDATGRPVSRAEVLLVVDSRHPGRPTDFVVDRTRTSASGRFTLGFTSGGAATLQVRAAGVGSAVRELELVAGEPNDLDDLALQGPGVLTGRLTDAGEEPVDRFELWALPAALTSAPNAPIRADRTAHERERGEGLTVASTLTDADGGFRFTGLAPGRYAIVAADDDASIAPVGEAWTPWTPASTRPTPDPIALTLDVHRLAVFVRDEGGRPLRGARVTISPLVPGPDGRLRPGRMQAVQATGDDAVASFTLEPESSFSLRVTAPGRLPLAETITTGARPGTLRREVRLEPESFAGTLRLDVRGPNGEPLTAWRAWVSPTGTGQPLAGFDGVGGDDEGRLPPLPHGRYDVTLRPLRTGDAPSTLLPTATTTPAEVLSGEETLVSIGLVAGGRLLLVLDLPPGHPLENAALGDAGFGQQTRRRRAARRLREHGATATLHPAGDDVPAWLMQPRTLQFEPPQEVGGLELQLLPGTSALVHDVLEPGDYTLRIETPGFELVETPVTIHGDHVLEIAIRLAATETETAEDQDG